MTTPTEQPAPPHLRTRPNTTGSTPAPAGANPSAMRGSRARDVRTTAGNIRQNSDPAAPISHRPRGQTRRAARELTYTGGTQHPRPPKSPGAGVRARIRVSTVHRKRTPTLKPRLGPRYHRTGRPAAPDPGTGKKTRNRHHRGAPCSPSQSTSAPYPAPTRHSPNGAQDDRTTPHLTTKTSLESNTPPVGLHPCDNSGPTANSPRRRQPQIAGTRVAHKTPPTVNRDHNNPAGPIHTTTAVYWTYHSPPHQR